MLSWTSHPAVQVHGVAVGVVDAYADTWGEGGRRVVAQVEVRVGLRRRSQQPSPRSS